MNDWPPSWVKQWVLVWPLKTNPRVLPRGGLYPEGLTQLANKFCRGFKVLDLITCELKVQVVVALGRHEVLYSLGRHEVLTNDMWHVLLQSENVFELGGITTSFNTKELPHNRLSSWASRRRFRRLRHFVNFMKSFRWTEPNKSDLGYRMSDVGCRI